MNLSKKQIEQELRALADKFEGLTISYSALEEENKDSKASIQAYKLENKSLKDSLTQQKKDYAELKAKLADTVNTKNQISHRQKELQLELEAYRNALNAAGQNSERLAHLIEFKEKKLLEFINSYSLPINRKLINQLKLLITYKA